MPLTVPEKVIVSGVKVHGEPLVDASEQAVALPSVTWLHAVLPVQDPMPSPIVTAPPRVVADATVMEPADTAPVVEMSLEPAFMSAAMTTLTLFPYGFLILKTGAFQILI